MTGLGLARSKEFVEKLEAELRAAQPGQFSSDAPRRGCLGALGLMLLATLAAWTGARG